MQDSRHDQYNKWVSVWEYTRDAIEGQDAIKYKQTKYLPMLNGQTPESYQSYLKRAQYVNFSSRTMGASLGQLFRKNPIIKEVDENVLDNINLAGASFNYFFRDIAREMLAVNRCGVLLDYSDYQKRPYLTAYLAESIINWRVSNIDGIEQLSMIMLEGKTSRVDKNDKYRTNQVTIWKELFLDDAGVYRVQNWIKNDRGEITPDGDEITPVIRGQVFTFIPFYIVTSQGINNTISKAAMVDFVNINLGHYVNSADYENLLHWTGAKTVITRGWGDKAFPVGGAADFPVDGGADFLEASSDSGLKDEMRHKEEQMAAMGSQIISGKGRYVASAETSRISSEGEYATLADISKSLSDSASKIMTDFNAWMGIDKQAEIEFNTDFEQAKIDPQLLTALMAAYQSGMISEETYFFQLKQFEMYPASWTYEDEQKAKEDSLKKQVERRDTLMPESLKPENIKAVQYSEDDEA
jgi:hypothetical protein